MNDTMRFHARGTIIGEPRLVDTPEGKRGQFAIIELKGNVQQVGLMATTDAAMDAFKRLTVGEEIFVRGIIEATDDGLWLEVTHIRGAKRSKLN